MTQVVAVSQLQPKDGQRGELVALLRELAVGIHAEPGGVHYSVHAPIADPDGPVTVIQVNASAETFREHAGLMRPHIPRLAALLATAPQPPVPLEPLTLSGHAKESFSREAHVGIPG